MPRKKKVEAVVREEILIVPGGPPAPVLESGQVVPPPPPDTNPAQAAPAPRTRRTTPANGSSSGTSRPGRTTSSGRTSPAPQAEDNRQALEEAGRQLGEVRAKTRELWQAVEDERGRLPAFRQVVETARQEIDEALRQAQAFRHRLGETERHFNEGSEKVLAYLQAHADTVHREMTEASGKAREYQQGFFSAGEQLVDEARQQVQAVGGEVEDARGQLQAALEEARRVRGEAEELGQRCRLADERLSELHREADETRGLINDVRQEHEEARRQLAAVRQEVEQARQELQGVRRELDAARAEAAVGKAAGRAISAEAREAVQDLEHVRQEVHEQRELAEASVLAQAVAPVSEERPRLGVTVDANAVVIEVVPESPAQKVGLKPGDAIATINEQPVHTSADVLAAIGQAPAGAAVVLGLARGDEIEEVKAQISEAPLPPSA